MAAATMNPAPATGSISERAVLAKLNVSHWTARKNDKRVNEEVAKNHNSDEQMGNYRKQLFAKEALQSIQAAVSNARREFYKRTLAWSDDGRRVSPSSDFFELTAEIRKLEREFWAAVDEFERNYPQYKEEGRKRLNGLGRDEDYPGVSQIRSKFDFKFTVEPLADTTDFRVKVGDTEAKWIADWYATEAESRIEGAMKEIWKRLFDVVAHMAERLRAYKPSEGKGKRAENTFHDTLVTNIREVLEIVPKLNITEDPAITQVAQTIEKELCAYEPDTLRESDSARNSTADAAEKIMKQMEDFL